MLTARRLGLTAALALIGASCGGDDASPAAGAAASGSRAARSAAAAGDAASLPGPVLSGTSVVAAHSAAVRQISVDTPDTQICSTRKTLVPVAGEPIRVILDTDFASDVDDVGALAVLHALADLGEVEILAVMVSNGGDAPAHRAIDAINTYYGRPDIPIGVVKGAAPSFRSVYVDALASRYPNDVQDPPAAVDLYRQVLAGQPDDSVTIVSVGYLTNLDALLSSPPDGRSASTGVELIAAKVRRWVAMGGHYPDSAAHPAGAEFNFVHDAAATANTVATWPTSAVFSGFEVGEVVLTGSGLQALTPPENPVREAYRLFNGGQNHASWDLTAVLVAVRATAGLFEVCSGRNVIGSGGANTWQFAIGGPHGHLRLLAPAAEVGAVLDGLLVAPPTRP
jgi:inosine-uridine nucleoside N-ribohydrolase